MTTLLACLTATLTVLTLTIGTAHAEPECHRFQTDADCAQMRATYSVNPAADAKAAGAGVGVGLLLVAGAFLLVGTAKR